MPPLLSTVFSENNYYVTVVHASFHTDLRNNEVLRLMINTGKVIKKGYCSCDLPILNFPGNFFTLGGPEAGSLLKNVTCSALNAVGIVVDVGMPAIPPPKMSITGGMSTHLCPIILIYES